MKKLLYAVLRCACIALVFVACESDEKPEPTPPVAPVAPAAAGVINGTIANECPAQTVTLTIDSVAHATAYVWYKNGAVIAEASGTLYTVTQSGTYTVNGKNDVGEGAKSPDHVVTLTACPGEDGAVPVAAGTITGLHANVCPEKTVALSIAPITGSTSYTWYTTWGPGDVDSTTTVEESYSIDFSEAGIPGQTVTVAVAGLNQYGKGVASPQFLVTKASCVPGKPVITTENVGWGGNKIADTTFYTNPCPETTITLLATTPVEDAPASSYVWYRQQITTGGDTEFKTFSAVTNPLSVTMPGGQVTKFRVKAFSADGGESEFSDVVEVIGVLCCQPAHPGNNNYGIFPTYSTIFPYSPSGAAANNIAVSNCQIQDLSGVLETGVELTCNMASAHSTDYPVLGYDYWVKTTPDGSYTKVWSSTGTSDRTVKITGTAPFVSGTYVASAHSACGDSPFSANYIAVNIRNDCPAPVVVLPAPTSIVNKVDGVITNVCPNLQVAGGVQLSIPAAPAGTVTKITWKRVTASNPTPEVVWEGSTATESYKGGATLTAAHNGTYTITYTKKLEAGGEEVESQPLTETIGLKLCAPTFASKPSGNVPPATYAVVTIASSTATDPLITGYVWQHSAGGIVNSTAINSIGTASSHTFHIYQSGSYTVTALSPYGNSAPSAEVVITITDPEEAPTLFTRDDLIGTYAVNDWYRQDNPAARTYTLTIAAGPADDEIIIKNLGGVTFTFESVVTSTTFTAKVDFKDGSSTGDYGTITIKKVVTGEQYSSNISHLSNTGNPPTCDGTNVDIVFNLKLLEGKPGVKTLNPHYGVWSGNGTCAARANSLGYGGDVVWTKND